MRIVTPNQLMKNMWDHYGGSEFRVDVDPGGESRSIFQIYVVSEPASLTAAVLALTQYPETTIFVFAPEKQIHNVASVIFEIRKTLPRANVYLDIEEAVFWLRQKVEEHRLEVAVAAASAT